MLPNSFCPADSGLVTSSLSISEEDSAALPCLQLCVSSSSDFSLHWCKRCHHLCKLFDAEMHINQAINMDKHFEIVDFCPVLEILILLIV